MKIVEFDPSSWFFLTDGNAFFMDVYCNHSFFGFTRTIQLDEAETAGYKNDGRMYLIKLAREIQYQALTVYKARNVNREIEEQISEAIIKFKEQTPPDLNSGGNAH
ncbi:MAG: hypothetical protein ACRCYO_09275 [Bacteroidia bacterium]